jgi:hypothetical protein
LARVAATGKETEVSGFGEPAIVGTSKKLPALADAAAKNNAGAVRGKARPKVHVSRRQKMNWKSIQGAPRVLRRI